MTKVENSGHWQCVPKIEKYDEDSNELPILKFYKFGALWWLKAKKVTMDGTDYCHVKVKDDSNWNGRTVMKGMMELRYGQTSRSIQFDIKKPMEFKKLCKWNQLVDMAKEDTKLHFGILIHEHYGINFRRTWSFDNCLQGITDGLIVCKNQTFYVSKAILSLHSPFFYERFRKTSIIDLPDLNGATMKVILDMIHPPCVLPEDWCAHEMDWETDVPIYKEKRKLTNTRYILKVAQLLKLAVVEQVCLSKMRHDGWREEDDGWCNGMPFVEMAEAIDNIRFRARSRSLDNCQLPVKRDNTISEVFIIKEINDRNMVVKFVKLPWKFEIENEQNDKLASIKLHRPYMSNPYQVTGHINLVFNGSKSVNMRSAFNIPYVSEEVLAIGKMDKKLMSELVATITITITIDRIDEDHQLRKYIDYNVNDPMISTGRIMIDGETFNVSKELLSYHSPVLQQMFLSSSDLNLSDVSAADFRSILNMIYPTMLMPIYRIKQKHEMESMAKLLEFAHRYDMAFVKERIEEEVRLSDVKDVGWKISTSDRFDMPNLMMDIGLHSSKDVEAFMTTDEYQQLSDDMKKYLTYLTVSAKEVDEYWLNYEKELKESGKTEEEIELKMIVLKMKGLK